MRRLKDGGSGAFELFVNEYEKLMFKAADEILHNFHDSEEAVYAALAAIARRFDSVKALAPPERAAYAWRAARSRAYGIYEKRQKRLAAETPLVEAGDIGECDAEIERLAEDSRLSADDIFAQMQKVPPLYRDALILHYADGKDVKTVARELGLKRETAKTRLARGKKILIKLLKEELGVQL